jgi:hypothetical protein
MDYDSQAFPIHRTVVTENAPIKAGCLSYFGIGIHRDQYQGIEDTLVQCSARVNADKRKNVDLKFEMSGDLIYQPCLAARF